MRLERDEIERRDFDRVLRGYDPDQVNAHLHEIAVAIGDLFDRLSDANVALPAPVRQRLEALVHAKKVEGEIERVHQLRTAALEIPRLVDESLRRFQRAGSSKYPPLRALVQRVSAASVTVGDEEVARIGRGLLVLLGVKRGDTADEADRIARKLLALRIFEDADGKRTLSVGDAGGEILCVSQFTLYGDARKGNRPSYVDAAPPEEAEPLYERVRAGLGAEGGVFGAHMQVELVNDGPVTLIVNA